MNHEWTNRLDLDFCKVCGMVRRRDDKNKPCKGPTRMCEMEPAMPEPEAGIIHCEHGDKLCECKFRAAKDALIKGGQEPFLEEVERLVISPNIMKPSLMKHANEVHTDWISRENCNDCGQIQSIFFTY